MKKMAKLLAVFMALSMLFTLAACGAKNESSKPDTTKAPAATASEATKSEATPGDVLKGILTGLQKVETYQAMKTADANATFTEKVENDSIVIDVTGTEYYDGTFTFPHKDGYLVCSVDSDNSISGMLSMFMLSAIANYYQINPTLLMGYTQGTQVMGIEDKFCVVDSEDDESGTVKYYIDEKPAMPHLNELNFNETVLSQHDGSDTSGYTENIGKLTANFHNAESGGTLAFTIGEFEGNTELTYQAIVNCVQHYQPVGYEDFLKDFTELKELSTDAYQVTFDQSKSPFQSDIQLIDGYKFVFVNFGAAETEIVEEAEE